MATDVQVEAAAFQIKCEFGVTITAARIAAQRALAAAQAAGALPVAGSPEDIAAMGWVSFKDHCEEVAVLEEKIAAAQAAGPHTYGCNNCGTKWTTATETSLPCPICAPENEYGPPSIEELMAELVDRLAAAPEREINPRAWSQLLVYAPGYMALLQQSR